MMHPAVSHALRNNRVEVNARRRSAAMIPIVVTAVVVAVVAAAAVVVDGVVVEIALTTAGGRRITTSPNVRRGITSQHPFPPATIVKSIPIRNSYLRSAHWREMTVSAPRTQSPTRTRVAKAAANRTRAANANSAKNVLMTAMRRPLIPPSNNASRSVRVKHRRRATKISAVRNAAKIHASNAVHRARGRAVRHRITGRKTVASHLRINARQATSNARKAEASRNKVVVTSKATVRAGTVATDAARHPAAVAVATASS